jgi:tetratricopeptide (TPR) repeat protein
MAALLVLVTIALYWPATGHDFVNYDDEVHVTRNLQVQRGLTLEGVRWAFLNPLNCNWHPLTTLSHMLDCQLFGLHPWGHHLTNVLLHGINALLVFALLQQMTGARWRSLFVAALFSVHPLRVESVAWVAERKDVLSGCFGLLTLITYARYAEGRGREDRSQNAETEGEHPTSRFYVLSLLFFACGLMSKATLVTWPFIMLLLDYWPLGRFKLFTVRRLVTEKIPFFALATVASVITLVVQKQAGAMDAVLSLPVGARAGNALISYCRYLAKLFWPGHLAVFYPHPEHWPLAEVLLAAGSLLAISGLLWTQRRRFPFLLMGWLWFGGMLVPMIGLVPSGGWAMADRHMYLPSLGVLILTVWGACGLTHGRRHRLLAMSVAGVVAVVLLLSLTRQQLGYWKDSEALFRHALEVTEDNYIAHNCLGVALYKKGQVDEAIGQYREAVRLEPNDSLAHDNLGLALVTSGQIDEAISHFQEALRLKPDNAGAHYDLGNALAKKGQIDGAISEFQESLCLQPDDAAVHTNLGNALAKKGQIDEAITQLREAIRLQPAEAEAYYNLGNAFVRRGQIEEAISQYEEAIRLKPDDADAHSNLGVALYRKGRNEEAISQFREALRLKPDHSAARRSLNSVLGTKAGSSRQSGPSTDR